MLLLLLLFRFPVTATVERPSGGVERVGVKVGYMEEPACQSYGFELIRDRLAWEAKSQEKTRGRLVAGAGR